MYTPTPAVMTMMSSWRWCHYALLPSIKYKLQLITASSAPPTHCWLCHSAFTTDWQYSLALSIHHWLTVLTNTQYSSLIDNTHYSLFIAIAWAEHLGKQDIGSSGHANTDGYEYNCNVISSTGPALGILAEWGSLLMNSLLWAEVALSGSRVPLEWLVRGTKEAETFSSANPIRSFEKECAHTAQ